MIPDILIALIALASMVSVPYIAYQRRNRSFDTPGGSVLLTYYTDGADVIPLNRGKIGDLQYFTLAITRPIRHRTGVEVEPALLYRVELPFGSRIHLVAISRTSGASQLNPSRGQSIMEKVDLEGDFYKYFSLYTQKDMQAEARYVLDPKAMVFVIDFCRSHNWEIVNNELYFLQVSGTGSANDPTQMFDDIKRFVDEIRPALERPLSDSELRASTPYGADHRKQFSCPLCAADMKNTGQYFECPNGHGVLLTGAALINLIKGKLTVPAYVMPVAPRTARLTCPACGNSMTRVAYNGSRTEIDSCPNCPYRWLDMADIPTSYI